MKKYLCFVLCTVILCGCLSLLLSGCGNASGKDYITSVDELRSPGTKLGALKGSAVEEITREKFPDAEVLIYNSAADVVSQILSGDIAGGCFDAPIARYIVAETDGIAVLPEMIFTNDVAYMFGETAMGKQIESQLNEFIARIKADGTLGEVDALWFGDDESKKVVDIPKTGANGTVKMATYAAVAPFSYRDGNGFAGYDIDIMSRFCREYGYALELEDIVATVMVDYAVHGIADVVGCCITVTEERKQSVTFSDPYYAGGVAVTVKAPVSETGKSFFDRVSDSFYKTFVKENRWKLILEGIWTTVLISVASITAGTLLGIGVCAMTLSKNRILKAVSAIYIKIMHGMPLLILLMILFYIVFADSGIPGEWVAVIAFSLNFAAFSGEIFKAGIRSVDKGQTEAALALGYTRAGAFFRIVLPAALGNCLPVYKGEAVSLVKMTSIVGYVAVEDLTMMSDIIRGRSYEAVFPLLTTAAIYFVICMLISLIIRRVTVRILPDRRRKTDTGGETK